MAGDFLSARDQQEIFPGARNSLIMALAGCLPREGSLLGVGLPGNAGLRAFRIARPDLHVVEALSSATMAAWPGFVGTMSDQIAVVDQTAGEIRVAETRPFAGHSLSHAGRLRPITPIARLFTQLARPALVLLGAEPGHDRLITALLPELARSRSLLWWDLAGRDVTVTLAGVLDALGGAEIMAYVLTRKRGLCRAADLQPGEGADVLLLVPTAAWDTTALDRGVGPDLSGLVTGGRVLRNRAALGPGAFARLAGLAPDVTQAWPDKIFLEAGTHVFAEGARLVHHDGTALLQTRWQPVARLLVHAPAPGRFTMGIPCFAAPSPELLAGLVLETGSGRVPFDWHAEWWQLRSRQPILCSDPRFPLVLNLRLKPGAAVAGIDLQLTGIEFKMEDRFGAGPVTGAVQQGDWQG